MKWVRLFYLKSIGVVQDEGIVLIHVPVKSAVTMLKKFVRRNIVHDLPSWAVDDDGDITHTMVGY